MKVSFRIDHIATLCSLYLDQLCVLITIYCKQKLLGWALRDALIYRNNDEIILYFFIVCLFIRIIVIRSPLRPMCCLGTPCWSDNAVKYVSCHFPYLCVCVSGLKPLREPLFTDFMPLLHWWLCLARPVIILTFRVQEARLIIWLLFFGGMWINFQHN